MHQPLLLSPTNQHDPNLPPHAGQNPRRQCRPLRVDDRKGVASVQTIFSFILFRMRDPSFSSLSARTPPSLLQHTTTRLACWRRQSTLEMSTSFARLNDLFSRTRPSLYLRLKRPMLRRPRPLPTTPRSPRPRPPQ